MSIQKSHTKIWSILGTVVFFLAGVFIFSYTTYKGFRSEVQNSFALLSSNNPLASYIVGNNKIEDLEPHDILKTSDGKIVVADTGHHRVLVYNTEPLDATVLPSLILGQPGYVFTTPGTSSQLFSSPESVSSDDGKLVVADTANHRVLIYTSFPTSDFQAADIVLGQPDFTSNTANNGGVSNHSFSSPTCVSLKNGKLLVADSGNNRVLIWNSLPVSNNQSADLVLGQVDFVSSGPNNGGIGGRTLSHPVDVSTDGTNVFITDQDNHRVLHYTAFPTINYEIATRVLGQPDFTSNTANNGGISGSSLASPIAARYDGTSLFIADGSNERVLIYPSLPTSDFEAATTIVGQINATSVTTSIVSAVYTGITRPYSDGTKLFLADQKNKRVLIFPTIPTSHGTPASKVLGQYNFTDTEVVDGSTIFTSSGTPVSGLLTWTGKMFLYSAAFTNRVLMFDTFPVDDRGAASRVIGALDEFTKNLGGAYGPETLFSAERASLSGVGSNGAILAVADPLAHRVLLWDPLPTVNHESADYVLGQADMTSGGFTTTSASTVQEISSISMERCMLALADASAHRVTLYPLPISQNNLAATGVIGQPDMLSALPNNGGVSATTLSAPRGVVMKHGKLLIADTGNNRVLIYNTVPTTFGAPADYVLGQQTFTTATANNLALNEAARLSSPMSVEYDGERIYVADHVNNRVLVWTTPITTNGQSANYVLGQNDFSSLGINPDLARATPEPLTVSYARGMLLVTTKTFARLFDVGALTSDVPSESITIALSPNNVMLEAHPSVRNGKSTPGYTSFSVETNAINGYTLYATLEDTSGVNVLRSSLGTIPSGVGLNAFGYEAFNGPYNVSHEVQVDNSFTDDPTPLYSGGAYIGSTGPTCGNEHTLYYGLQVDYTVPAGTYAGNVLYTAVGNF